MSITHDTRNHYRSGRPRFLSVFESVMIRIIDATEGAVDTTFRYRNEYAEKTTSQLSECRRVLEYIEEREKRIRVINYGKMSLLRV